MKETQIYPCQITSHVLFIFVLDLRFFSAIYFNVHFNIILHSCILNLLFHFCLNYIIVVHNTYFKLFYFITCDYNHFMHKCEIEVFP